MKTVKYAIVGCGSVSWNRYFKQPNFDEVASYGGQLVAVCDSFEDRARRPAVKFNVPYFLDLDEMLAKVEFDLLVNLTNVPAHFATSLKGLQAGRHVYTQKPVTVTQPATHSTAKMPLISSMPSAIPEVRSTHQRRFN